MSVERRYNKRYPMKGEVYIRYRKQQVFPANAANCSMQGIFLHTRNLTMITGAMVELEFFYSGRHWIITGIVTHAQMDGVGIMFWRPQPELYDAIILDASRNQPISQQDEMATVAGTVLLE